MLRRLKMILVAFTPLDVNLKDIKRLKLMRSS